MKVQNMSSHWNLKAARPSYKQKFVFFLGQNGQTVWPKFKNIKGNWTSPEHFTKYWLLQRFHFLREDWAQGNVLPNFEIFLLQLLKQLVFKVTYIRYHVPFSNKYCQLSKCYDLSKELLRNNTIIWLRNCL